MGGILGIWGGVQEFGGDPRVLGGHLGWGVSPCAEVEAGQQRGRGGPGSLREGQHLISAPPLMNA